MVLVDLKPELKLDFNLVAISRDGELLIPRGNSDIRLGDRVYATGTPEALHAFARVLEKKLRPVQNVMISGGGGAIPQRLDGIGRHYLLVEAHPQAQRFLSAPVRVYPEE